MDLQKKHKRNLVWVIDWWCLLLFVLITRDKNFKVILFLGLGAGGHDSGPDLLSKKIF